MSPRPRLTILIGAAVIAATAVVAPPSRADDSPTPGIERPAEKPVAAKTPTAKAKAVVRKTKQATKASGDHVQVGVASWYGKRFAKKKTTNGEKFSPNLPTAAHRTLPLGTHVKVTNLATGQSTTVRVNDRGPYAGGRVIDLSQSAATDIGMKHDGVAPVKIEVVGHDTSASPAANNEQVKQEATAQKSDGPTPMTETASTAPVPSAPSTADASPPPQTSVAVPAAQPKPVTDESSKPWRRLNRR